MKKWIKKFRKIKINKKRQKAKKERKKEYVGYSPLKMLDNNVIGVQKMATRRSATARLAMNM